MFTFPQIANSSDFDKWRGDRRLWESLVHKIARAADVPVYDIAAFSGGTNLVVDLGGKSILKVFPPIYRGQFLSERAALRQLAGHLSITIPELIAEGGHSGWSWLIMTSVTGTVGAKVWAELNETQKEEVLTDIGRTITEVQTVPVGDLTKLAAPWSAFVKTQMGSCIERHRRQDLPHRFLDDLERLLASAPDLLALDMPDVILTSDWIPENFLISQEGSHWRLSGLVDFGDVRTGWGEYDLLAPSATLCEGRAGRVRSLFDGYGAIREHKGSPKRRRLLLLMALHQQSDFRKLTIPDWEEKITDLFDLEQLIWPNV